MRLLLRIYCVVLLYCRCSVYQVSSLIGDQDITRLHTALTQLCTDELHHSAFSNIFDNSTIRYISTKIDGDLEVEDLSNRVARNIRSVVTVVDNNGQKMENSYSLSRQMNQMFHSENCCNIVSKTTYNARFKGAVNESITCSRLYSPNSKNRMAPGFIGDFKQNTLNNPGITWQYSGDINGAYHQYPASNNTCKGNKSMEDDFRYQSWYVNTVTPKKKNIVIVLDESGTMQMVDDYRTGISRIERAKVAAQAVIDTLSARDWAGVVAFSDVARSPPGCFGTKIAQANEKNKNKFKSFIHTLKPKQGTMYSEGLSTAFNMMSQAKKDQPSQFDDSMDIIIFLTDGDPRDPNGPDKIRQVIADGNSKLNNKARIFFYGLGNSIGQHTNVSDLLSFADQNNRNLTHNHIDRSTRQTNLYSAPKWKNRASSTGPPGYFTVISGKKAHTLRDVMAGYYLNYPHSVSRQPSFTVPFVDSKHGLTVTVTKPLLDNRNATFGVTAVNAKFDSLFDDVTYYRKGQYSYALLVTREGKVLSHRSFARPSKARPDINFVTLDIAEPSLSNQTVKDIIQGKTGSKREQVSLAMSRGVSRQDGSYQMMMNATYHYRPVVGYEKQYSVVIVMFDEDTQLQQKQFSSSSHKPKNKLSLANYHKALDPNQKFNAQQPANTCVTKQKAIIDKKRSTIKLAANAFVNPTRYLTELETTHNVSTIRNLLKDQISKPNKILRTEALEDIIFTSKFETVLGLSPPSQAVYRYMATSEGVFRIAPGILMEKYYDPGEQPWYRQSSLYQDKCVYTRAGYSPSGDENLLSISQALLDPQKNMIGSVGADITLSYIRSMLYVNIPECNSQQWSCSLLDHSGYVVTEGVKSKSTFDQSLNHYHFSDVYPEIVDDIITKHNVIKLRWCRRLHGSMQSQMFYTFDTTYDKVSSDTGAAACETYHLHNLKDTNLHILVTSSVSCAPQGNSQQQSKCQCSNKCTQCNITKATCQCPCTCDAGADPCTNRYDVVFPPITCPAPWIPVKPPKLSKKKPTLKVCPTDCHQRLNQTHCGSDSNCKWCTAGPTPVCLRSCPVRASGVTTTPASVTTPLSTSSATVQSAGGTSSGSAGSTTVSAGSQTSPGAGGSSVSPAVPSIPGSSSVPGGGVVTTLQNSGGGNYPSTRSVPHTTGSGSHITQSGSHTTQGGGGGTGGNTQSGAGGATTPNRRYTGHTQTPVPGCDATQNLYPVTVLMKQAQPAPVCQIDYEKFCAKHCSAPPPVIQTCKQTSDKEKDDDYKNLAAGLGVPLAALAALSAIALFALLRKKPPIPLETPNKIKPVEPFVPNIYRASMGDTSLPTVGKKGATLDDWNSNGQAMFGRVSISE